MCYMKAYPIELRTRVLDAVDSGVGTQKQIAKIFEVSVIWIQKLLHKRRYTGSIEPLPRTQGRKPAFNKELLQELDELLDRRFDLTLAEIQQYFKGRVNCSHQAVANALKRLGWGYKKNRYVRLNKIEKM